MVSLGFEPAAQDDRRTYTNVWVRESELLRLSEVLPQTSKGNVSWFNDPDTIDHVSMEWCRKLIL